eukprot:sb/3462013/
MEKVEYKLNADDKKEVVYENLFCRVCNKGDRDDAMLLCDECDEPYHIFCLSPPLERIPNGEWRCPICLAKELENRSFGFEQSALCLTHSPFFPQELENRSFGFEQAKKEYTLTQFGQMADNFKSRYFKQPASDVPIEDVEKEFWRLVCCVDEDVAVEYGADLLSTDLDSGFPIPGNAKTDVEKEYATDPWNLTKFADLEESVLKYIHEPISGVKIPWVYVGMVFSSFCWHVEDHWTYSINYQHWGEPKVWYGIPDSGAPDFEDIIKKEAPELFTREPSLMHQLVTTLSPKLLFENVYTLHQNPGDFIITFPRAYHAGFNSGFNFNEACNFATSDWVSTVQLCNIRLDTVIESSDYNSFASLSNESPIYNSTTHEGALVKSSFPSQIPLITQLPLSQIPLGRKCVDQYREFGRYNVFSHEELLMRMVDQQESLLLDTAQALAKDLRIPFKSSFPSQIPRITQLPLSQIPLGRKCVDQYREFGRYNVFSHEELLMRMVDQQESLLLDTAQALAKDLRVAVDREIKERALMVGIKEEFVKMEDVPDEKRVCKVCNTTMFFSALTCTCHPEAMFCLQHFKSNSCEDKRVLQYRYTVEELRPIPGKVEARIPHMKQWTTAVQAIKTMRSKPSIEELERLCEEAVIYKYTNTEDYKDLRTVIDKASQCIKVTNQLVSIKRRSNRAHAPPPSFRISLEELDSFLKQVIELPCHVPDSSALQEHYIKIVEFTERCDRSLQKTMSKLHYEDLLKESRKFEIELPHTSTLKQVSFTQRQHCGWNSPKGVDGAMTQCDLCYDWFHNKCVSISKNKDMKNSETMKDVKYLCPLCQRTKRPTVEQALGLLISLRQAGINCSFIKPYTAPS